MQNNTINWWLIAPFSEQTRKDIDLNYQLSGGLYERLFAKPAKCSVELGGIK